MSKKKIVESQEELAQVELQEFEVAQEPQEPQESDNAEESQDPELEEPSPPKDKHTLRCEQIAQAYAKNYPEQSEFHITSDFQVFLGGDASLAYLHQNTLSEGELKTIKTN